MHIFNSKKVTTVGKKTPKIFIYTHTAGVLKISSNFNILSKISTRTIMAIILENLLNKLLKSSHWRCFMKKEHLWTTASGCFRTVFRGYFCIIL